MFYLEWLLFVRISGVDNEFSFGINRNCRGRPSNEAVGQQG